MKNTKKRVQPAAKGPVLKPFVESTPENELRGLLIAVGLTFLVYIPSLFNGFTNWDDNGYVTTNPLLWNLNAEGLIKLLSEPVMGNFHPLTMLTYALEYKLAGLKPFLYHLTNLVLHLLNTWLVYRLVMMLSGKVVVAFITAVLFGIHPMHVESVAWISERKDVLYALFFLLSLIMYVHYVRRNLAVKYLVFSILFFILSCFSKGQAVSLAVLLFALDYWLKRELGLRLVIEKIPYFAVALVFGIIAVSIQHSFGYMTAINMYSFTDRIFFAFYALVLYLGKLILPVNLSCFYPFPQKKDLLMYVSPAIMLAAAFLIWRTYKSTRLWVFGFSFFLITIFLLLQLVPVGGAVISERYTYIPYIGLFFIAGSLADSILQRRAKSARALAVLFTVILISYSAASVARIRVWKDSITLWSDALKKDNMVAVSYNNRASAYKDLKENEKALADYTKALQLNPNYYEALVGRGELLRIAGQVDQALADLNRAIEMKPESDWTTYMSRAVAFCIKGQLDKAKQDFDKAFEKAPSSPELYCNRGNYHDMIGEYQKAIEDYTAAARINPLYENAYLSRGAAKARKGYLDEALQDFNEAIRVKPDYAEAYYDRSNVYKSKGEYGKALEDAIKARDYGFSVSPDYIEQLKQLSGRN